MERIYLVYVVEDSVYEDGSYLLTACSSLDKCIELLEIYCKREKIYFTEKCKSSIRKNGYTSSPNRDVEFHIKLSNFDELID